MVRKLSVAISGALIAIGALTLPISQSNLANANPAVVIGNQVEERVIARSLSFGAYKTHAATIFNRADFDRDNQLGSDEFATLQLVKAELLRLNGFLTIEAAGQITVVKLAKGEFTNNNSTAFKGFSRAERLRIDAVSRKQFYKQAGLDSKMSLAEFLEMTQAEFSGADSNGDKKLEGRELKRFAKKLASIVNIPNRLTS